MSNPQFPRAFVLRRGVDHTGVSGTGTVAAGAVFPDGTVALRWRGAHASTVIWTSLDDALAVHGHDGATVPVWPEDSRAEQAAEDATAAERYGGYLNAARDALGAPDWPSIPDRARGLIEERNRLARDAQTLHDGINAAAREAFAERRRHRDALRAVRQQAIEAVETHAARMGAAAQLADSLADALAGDDWRLADTIRRLCRGEITPQQALDATAA